MWKIELGKIYYRKIHKAGRASLPLHEPC